MFFHRRVSVLLLLLLCLLVVVSCLKIVFKAKTCIPVESCRAIVLNVNEGVGGRRVVASFVREEACFSVAPYVVVSSRLCTLETM